MNHEPRLLREALLVELAGELDNLLVRVERVVPDMAASADRCERGAQELGLAATQARDAISQLTARTLQGIAEYATRRATETAQHTAEAQRALLQVCARDAFARELTPSLTRLTVALAEGRRPREAWLTWCTHAATALFSAVATAAVVLLALQR